MVSSQMNRGQHIGFQLNVVVMDLLNKCVGRCFYMLFFGLTLSACGYHFQGSSLSLPSDIKKIYVAPVENLTTDSTLTLEFTEALRSRFEAFGALQVVDKREEADAIMAVTVHNLSKETRTVTGTSDIALEQLLRMDYGGKLERRTGQVLWADPSMTVSETFANTSNVVVTSSSQFAQSGISGATLGGLEDRELSRGQERETVSNLVESATRTLYLDSVAADF